MNLKQQMKSNKNTARENKYKMAMKEISPIKKKNLRTNKLINVLKEFVKNNIKEYIIITLVFLIGIF